MTESVPIWPSSTNFFLIIFCIFMYLYLTRHFNYWRKRGVTYLKPVPLFGNFFDVILFRKHSGLYLKELYDQIKAPFFGIFVFDKPILVVKSPELVKSIFIKDFNYFADRALVFDEDCDPFFSNFLISLKSPEWKLIRQKFTSAFTSGKLKNMFALIDEIGGDLNGYLKSVAHNGGVLEAKELCMKFSTDVISSCAFGINAQSFEKTDAPFHKAAKSIFAVNVKTGIQQSCYFFFPSLVRLFKMKFIDPSVAEFLTNAFWKVINERGRTQAKRNDLIDILIELKKKEVKFVGPKVVGQAGQFFVAGFETMSGTMAFVLYELALHPKIQARLREEIKNSISSNGGLNFEAIKGMKYCDMVISETLRKYPSFSFIDRVCINDYQIPSTNVVIEKRTAIFIPLLGFHYDPEFFPDPHKFDPERFTEENVQFRPPMAYFPFGEGPRHCIGKRFSMIVMKVGLAQMLLDFEVEKCEETPVPVVLNPKTFLSVSKVGLPIRFKPS